MADPDVADIAQQRLLAHGLAGAPFAGMTEAVGWLGAVQSQEYAVAKWSVGQRATGLTDADLDQALADGTIIRTHVLRPTWHFVAAADVRWMLALTGPRVHAMSASYHRRHGLDEATFARGNAELVRVLEGGNQLTRNEIAAALAGAGIATDNMAVGFLLLYAELSAVVCSGGLKGKQRMYALFDERVPPAPSVDRDQALAELTRRYFVSRGPATRADYQSWSSLTAADAKRGLELAAADLERAEWGGQTFWYAATPRPGSPDPSPTVHLLQGYDEYFVAYLSSRFAYDPEGRLPAGAAGPQSLPAAPSRAPFLHGIILDGRYAGSWRRTLAGNRMAIDVRLPRPFGAAERAALREAVDRYAAFVGLPATLNEHR